MKSINEVNEVNINEVNIRVLIVLLNEIYLQLLELIGLY